MKGFPGRHTYILTLDLYLPLLFVSSLFSFLTSYHIKQFFFSCWVDLFWSLSSLPISIFICHPSRDSSLSKSHKLCAAPKKSNRSAPQCSVNTTVPNNARPPALVQMLHVSKISVCVLKCVCVCVRSICGSRYRGGWSPTFVYSAHEFCERLGSWLSSSEHQRDPMLDWDSPTQSAAAAGRGSTHHAYSWSSTTWLTWPLSVPHPKHSTRRTPKSSGWPLTPHSNDLQNPEWTLTSIGSPQCWMERGSCLSLGPV